VADPLRLAIVDNYPIFRDGVVQALRKQKHIVVAAEGATARDAEQFASSKAIDILLLEIAVPGSMRSAQTIMRAHPDVKVVFLASTDDDEQATQALRAGAHGYIMKGITGPDLIKAIEAIHSGDRYITSDLAWRLVTKPAPAAPEQGIAYGKPLSLREQQVLDHTSKGLTNQEIARVLGLTVSTIKYYKTLAFRKVGARNRLEAIFSAGRGAKDN
jgi:DNA-binding NarL/FixJ family response regulator